MIAAILLIFLITIVLFWQSSLLIATITGAPSVFANKEAIEKALELAGVKKYETIVDFGCGDARSLIIAAKKFGAKGIGVERSIYCYLLSWLKILISGQKRNVKIYFGNFENDEKILKEADVIYLYLLNSVMKEKEQWFFENVKKDARIVSLAFKFVNHKEKSKASTINLGIKTEVYLYSK